LVFGLGCAIQITDDGFQAVSGQAQATTCGPIPDPTRPLSEEPLVANPEVLARPTEEEQCSTIQGGTASDNIAQIMAPFFQLLLKFLPAGL